MEHPYGCGSTGHAHPCDFEATDDPSSQACFISSFRTWGVVSIFVEPQHILPHLWLLPQCLCNQCYAHDQSQLQQNIRKGYDMGDRNLCALDSGRIHCWCNLCMRTVPSNTASSILPLLLRLYEARGVVPTQRWSRFSCCGLEKPDMEGEGWIQWDSDELQERGKWGEDNRHQEDC